MDIRHWVIRDCALRACVVLIGRLKLQWLQWLYATMAGILVVFVSYSRQTSNGDSSECFAYRCVRLVVLLFVSA